MSIKNRTTLKSFFQLKDRPSESQFIDLIDSQFNLNEDNLDDIADGGTNKLITAAEKADIHDPKLLGTKEIDESAIGNNKLIKYNSATGKLEFTDAGSGSGDVVGPATNTDGHIPQWDGADSKTLKNGLAVPAGGLAGLTALGDKVDKVSGKSLSTEDYSSAEKTKLSGIASGAEVNVNADWNAVSGDAQILNKPMIPTTELTIAYSIIL